MNKKVIFFTFVLLIIVVLLSVILFIDCNLNSVDVSDYSADNNRNIISNSAPSLSFDGEYLYTTETPIVPLIRRFPESGEKMQLLSKPWAMKGGVLLKNILLFYKDGSSLVLQNRKDNSQVIIDNSVVLFQYDSDCIYYQKREDKKNCSLIKYDITTQNFEVIAESITTFALNDNCLWILKTESTNENMQIFKYELEKQNCYLWETVSLYEYEYVKRLLVCSDYLIISFSKNDKLLLINTVERSTQILQDAKGQAELCANCSDRYLFFSYSMYELYDKKDIASVCLVGYGLYKFDFITGEIAQISETTFDEIYIFNNDVIWGRSNNKLFCLSTDGQVLQVFR